MLLSSTHDKALLSLLRNLVTRLLEVGTTLILVLRDQISIGSRKPTKVACNKGDETDVDQVEAKRGPQDGEKGLHGEFGSVAGLRLEQDAVFTHAVLSNAVRGHTVGVIRAVVSGVSAGSQKHGKSYSTTKRERRSAADSSLKPGRRLTKEPSAEKALHDQDVSSGVNPGTTTTSQQPEVVKEAQSASDKKGDDCRAVSGGGVDDLVVGPDLKENATGSAFARGRGETGGVLTMERMKIEKLKASKRPKVMALMVRMLRRMGRSAAAFREAIHERLTEPLLMNEDGSAVK